jgi:hypothetical protein
MIIQLDTLRSALNQLLDLARARHGDQIAIDADYYWFVQREALEDPTQQPAEGALTLGSGCDDWAELAAIANGEKPAIGYAMVWAAGVLRMLGDRTVY